MSEPLDFPVELRADAATMTSHPYTTDLLGRAADEIERLRAALRSPAREPEQTVPEGWHKVMEELATAAEGFRAAMIESGALNKVSQDRYFIQLRRLETALSSAGWGSESIMEAPPLLAASPAPPSSGEGEGLAGQGMKIAANSPIGEICADCGREIGMFEASYYRKDPNCDIGRAFHGRCGDPFGSKAKDALIETMKRALTEIEDGFGPNHGSGFCREVAREALSSLAKHGETR